MKIKYDVETDILLVAFSESQISESDEVRPGVILDYDGNGTINRIEILGASKLADSPLEKNLEFIPE